VSWRWPSLLAGLLILAVALAVVDSAWLREWFPNAPAPRPLFPLIEPTPARRRTLLLLARAGSAPRTEGLYSFWWFVSAGVAFVVAAMAAIVLFPRRVRLAVERLESPGGLGLALAAGFASALLFAGAVFVFRVTFFLLPLVPVVLVLAAVGAVFGVACVGFSIGRRLRSWLGGAGPLLLAFTGVLALFDLALIPFAGWLALAVLLLVGLGVAVITRLGTAPGWSVEELNW
jgi:hypothetical protein